MSIHCIIIDDEPPAHNILEHYISKVKELKLIGSFFNCLDANAYLKSNSVDLIFLDINMPELTGLEFLSILDKKPAIILTTAYSEYAIEAFEYEVLDYLLKPLRLDRFLKSVNRLQKDTTIQNNERVSNPSKIDNNYKFYKINGIDQKIIFKDIIYVEAKGNYAHIISTSKKYLVASTMSQLEKDFTHSKIIRVHKSYFVNSSLVDAIHGNRIMITNTTIPIGASYKEYVRKLLLENNS